MIALVDTNVLVYAFDPAVAVKQHAARALLGDAVRAGSLYLPHQALLEFVSATTRPRRRPDGGPPGPPLLTRPDAWREVETFLALFPVLYPTEEVVRTALRGAATYRFSWWDAHLWAYAEVYGLPVLLSEDFEDGAFYGGVQVLDPFLAAAGSVNESAAAYGSEMPSARS